MKLGKVLQPVFVSALAGISVGASAQSADSYRFILETDKALSATKILTSEMTASRYMAIGVRSLQLQPGKQPRMLTDSTYAVDCVKPQRIQPLTQRMNKAAATSDIEDWVVLPTENIPSSFTLDSIPYVPLEDWLAEQGKAIRSAGVIATAPNAVSVAVQFACRAAAADPSTRDALAEDIRRTADASDLKELECSFTSPGGKRFDSTMGFSESRRYVRWNGAWSNGASVKEGQIGFSNAGMSVSVNRRTGAMEIAISGIPSTGVCEKASTAPRKF
jgi:hypothetical protein